MSVYNNWPRVFATPSEIPAVRHQIPLMPTHSRHVFHHMDGSGSSHPVSTNLSHFKRKRFTKLQLKRRSPPNRALAFRAELPELKVGTKLCLQDTWWATGSTRKGELHKTIVSSVVVSFGLQYPSVLRLNASREKERKNEIEKDEQAAGDRHGPF